MDSNDPVATAAVHAIRTGDTTSLASLLSQHPGLASEQIHESRTPLHVITDWPGYFPGSIGTPLDNAVGYGCWNVARLLVQRGARVDKLWQACHGGQRRTAERLLASGADLGATPGYSDQAPAEAAAEPGTQRENLITWLNDQGPNQRR